ncbi:hypothetical protein HY570_00965 [Candidatus Micrarchaeota archaeon]|nr:hypothetical protein [Candidatus Micrarchaeota archaeon]
MGELTPIPRTTATTTTTSSQRPTPFNLISRRGDPIKQEPAPKKQMPNIREAIGFYAGLILGSEKASECVPQYEGVISRIEAGGHALYVHDQITGDHSYKVAELVANCSEAVSRRGDIFVTNLADGSKYSLETWKKLLTPEILFELMLAGYGHDLGKIYVPIDILDSARKFTNEEYAIMREHPTDSLRIILGILQEEHVQAWHDFLKDSRFNGLELSDQRADPRFVRVALMAERHHELDFQNKRFNTFGVDVEVDHQLVRLASEIITIWDMFEAMTSFWRRYHKGKTLEGAYKKIREIHEKGGIDRGVFRLFEELHNRYEVKKILDFSTVSLLELKARAEGKPITKADRDAAYERFKDLFGGDEHVADDILAIPLYQDAPEVTSRFDWLFKLLPLSRSSDIRKLIGFLPTATYNSIAELQMFGAAFLGGILYVAGQYLYKFATIEVSNAIAVFGGVLTGAYLLKLFKILQLDEEWANSIKTNLKASTLLFIALELLRANVGAFRFHADEMIKLFLGTFGFISLFNTYFWKNFSKSLIEWFRYQLRKFTLVNMYAVGQYKLAKDKFMAVTHPDEEGLRKD